MEKLVNYKTASGKIKTACVADIAQAYFGYNDFLEISKTGELPFDEPHYERKKRLRTAEIILTKLRTKLVKEGYLVEVIKKDGTIDYIESMQLSFTDNDEFSYLQTIDPSKF